MHTNIYVYLPVMPTCEIQQDHDHEVAVYGADSLGVICIFIFYESGNVRRGHKITSISISKFRSTPHLMPITKGFNMCYLVSGNYGKTLF